MKSHISLLLFLCALGSLFAQSDDCHYQLSSQATPYASDDYDSWAAGTIAKIKGALELEKNNITSTPQKDYRQAYDEGADFLIDLIEQEFFLIDEDLNDQVEKIAAQIIEANDIQRHEKMRFMIARSGIPNAFTLRDGTIVINLGLLSRLHNWNQLAFILCHEMAHHHEDHVNKKVKKQIDLINSSEFKKKLKAAKKGKNLANQALSELLRESGLTYARHSRDAELETDALGFEFYKKAGFPVEEAYSALAMLQQLDFPKYKLPVLSELFDFPEIPWKADWQKSHLSGLSLVALSEEEKEDFRTHPQVAQRLQQIIELGAVESDQHSFVLCEPSVHYDLEILEHFYNSENAFEAFLLSLQLTTITADNAYVMEMIANCLLNFTIARKEHRFSKYVPAPGRKLSDQENEIATFLDNLRLSELSVLSKAFVKKYIDLNHTTTAVAAIQEKLKIIEN